jgi:hypothetical protein
MADDPFIATKMGNHALEIAKMNKEKKARIAYDAKKDAADLVLNRLEHELDNDINKLCGKDLDTLLCWKGIVGKLPNITNKHAMYLQLSTKGGKENEGLSIILAWWTEAEVELEALKNVPIKMGNTAYGRHEAQIRRDAKTAFKKMSEAEREAFLRMRLMRMPARRTSHSHPTTSRQYKFYHVICLLFIHYHNSTIGFYFIK